MSDARNLLDKAKNNNLDAIKQLEILSTLNPPDLMAINNLGVCYEFGYSVGKDPAKAVTFYRRAAALGDDIAMCNLGLANQAGRGTPFDLSLAAYWYLESAKKNTTNPNGSRRAIEQLEKLAKAESPHKNVLNNLGVCYEFGYSVGKDPAKAVTFYRRAADLGDDIAMCNLGLANQAGRGTPFDLSSAAYWYLESAKKNTTNPNGSRRAIEQLEKLAKAESPHKNVLNNLGVCYASGYGVTQNQKKAITFYRRAADLGNDTAMCNLGLANQAGRGTPPDLSLATHWYLESAQKNTTDPNGSLRAIRELMSLSKKESKQELTILRIRNQTTSTNSDLKTQSSVTIQRVWRGYRVRNEIALTMPTVLTHSTRLQLLYNLLSHFQKEEIESRLFAVHATDYFPVNGIIRVVDPIIRGDSHFRPTTHFALGELVRPHTAGKGTWENKKFAIITPLKDLLPQLLSLNVYDTFILGDFKLTKDSIVFVPANEMKQFSNKNSNLNVVGYDSKEGLRHSVKNLIIRQGGFDVVTFANEEKNVLTPAFLCNPQLYNINTSSFFSPILRQQKKVAFGKHCYSLFGSYYLFGVIDNALTQLGFYPNYFGHVYNKDVAFSKLIIKYAIERIESNPDFKKHSGFEVLKFHLVRAREGLQKIANGSKLIKSFAGDYTKARITRLLNWPDLFSFMQNEKSLALFIHNFQAFLCMYAYFRTCVVGEDTAKKERLMTIFSHNFYLLNDHLQVQVIGTILSVRSESNGMKVFPGGSAYLMELLTFLIRKFGIVINPSDDLDAKANKVWKNLQEQQLLWLPMEIDTPDVNGNVPIVQALIARDEKKALSLLNAGANMTNVYGPMNGRNTAAPLLSVALHNGMIIFANALLQHPNYDDWDKSDGKQNTPLCEAIVIGEKNIAVHLIERGADVNRRPNYSAVEEKDLVSLAKNKGLIDVASLLQEYGCRLNNPPPSKRACLIM